MYFYIYDSILSQKKYGKLLAKIETKLANLGITGTKKRLSILKSTEEIIKGILQKRDEEVTVIVIGKDQAFFQAAIALAGSPATLGFIPIESSSLIANILGLPTKEHACDVISARKIEKLSYGKINRQYFFSSVEFPIQKVKVFCDDKYQIIPNSKVELAKVMNLDALQFREFSQDTEIRQMISNPKDRYLELLIGKTSKKAWIFKGKEKKDSLFFVQKIKIQPKKADKKVFIKVDKERTIKAPALIEIAGETIKVIVGKDRLI